MSKNTHGHDVLNRMIGSGRGYTREELRHAMDAIFETAAHFDACAAEALIDFLVSKGTLRTEEDGWHVNEGAICEG